jgi:hypothetical protein
MSTTNSDSVIADNTTAVAPATTDTMSTAKPILTV